MKNNWSFIQTLKRSLGPHFHFILLLFWSLLSVLPHFYVEWFHVGCVYECVCVSVCVSYACMLMSMYVYIVSIDRYIDSHIFFVLFWACSHGSPKLHSIISSWTFLSSYVPGLNVGHCHSTIMFVFIPCSLSQSLSRSPYSLPKAISHFLHRIHH